MRLGCGALGGGGELPVVGVGLLSGVLGVAADRLVERGGGGEGHRGGQLVDPCRELREDRPPGLRPVLQVGASLPNVAVVPPEAPAAASDCLGRRRCRGVSLSHRPRRAPAIRPASALMLAAAWSARVRAWSAAAPAFSAAWFSRDSCGSDPARIATTWASWSRRCSVAA